MDTPVTEQGSSLETAMKRGALVCVVAMGGVAVGLAVGRCAAGRTSASTRPGASR